VVTTDDRGIRADDDEITNGNAALAANETIMRDIDVVANSDSFRGGAMKRWENVNIFAGFGHQKSIKFSSQFAPAKKVIKSQFLN